MNLRCSFQSVVKLCASLVVGSMSVFSVVEDGDTILFGGRRGVAAIWKRVPIFSRGQNENVLILWAVVIRETFVLDFPFFSRFVHFVS